MEFKIEHVEVYGLDKALIASGNPMRTNMADNRVCAVRDDERRGLVLAGTLPGGGHDNWLNGVIVQMDVYAPLFWWKQAQRYHWFDFISSQSTMHRAMSFSLDNAFVADVDPRVINILSEIKMNYEMAEDSETKQKLWKTFIATLPSGFILGATMTTNYRQLKTMYLQRRNHKLKEWHDFCKFCEELPLFKEMIEKIDKK